MSTVKEHYDAHLAPMYTWMRGGAESPRRQFTEQLRTWGIRPSRPGALAVDLGAGSGFQTLPLAAAGFAVTAIDLSELLLAELARDAQSAGLGARVRTVAGDMLDLSRHATGADVIVCMGDTLTHLATLEHVERLLRDIATALAPGGHALLSFRDYSKARSGAERFIPVRSDAERIFTCFLEFGATHLTVHDLVHTHTDGQWRLSVSTFEKVRIDPAWVRARLASAHLALVHDQAENGFVTFVARRAPAS